jgi:hypothetical protein
MPINMTCPSCGKMLAAPDSAAGKRAKCASCSQVMNVPTAAQPIAEFGALPTQPPPAPPDSQSWTARGESWLDDLGGPSATPSAVVIGPDREARRPCPECGEMIIAEAAKCRFCNAIFGSKMKPMSFRKSEKLKQLAQSQRGLNLAVLGQVIAYGLVVVARTSHIPMLALVGVLALLVSGIAGIVFVVLTAMRLYSTSAAIGLAVVMLIPCVGLLLLLSINSAATKRLKDNGIKVGLLGANMSQF